MCVQVCPTGIDIRNGLQYECIGCAACIDACDQVMDRMGYPKGLIRYSTENAIEKGFASAEMKRHVLRPRVFVYAGILLAVVATLLVALYVRVPLKVEVLADRASLMREVEGGRLENVYRLRITNTQEAPRRYRISASGIDSLTVASDREVEVPSATSRIFPMRLRIDPGVVAKGSHRIEVEVQAIDDPNVAERENAVFLVR
jgi:cytochrome c oxidase accessory protein FixG